MKFYGELEFLSGQKAGLLTLTNEHGEWSGSGRIEARSGRRADIYEEAYRQANLNATAKGGHLERFSVVDRPEPPPERPCKSRVAPPFLHRKANALNIEPMQPMARCLNRRPSHWPASMSSIRWIASGGEVLVFGHCTPAACPFKRGVS